MGSGSGPDMDAVPWRPAITAGLLRLMAGQDLGPADLAYAALDAGLIANHTGRPWRRQGASFIGGAIQARLVRAGLLRAYGGLTDRGRRLLAPGAQWPGWRPAVTPGFPWVHPGPATCRPWPCRRWPARLIL